MNLQEQIDQLKQQFQVMSELLAKLKEKTGADTSELEAVLEQIHKQTEHLEQLQSAE